ncbi:MAG: DNA alkylation repair protein [Bacteriovoracaceae bacterium]|nr:DNA alkylation repair protein [Bacteriovoracaceae bacterium]
MKQEIIKQLSLIPPVNNSHQVARYIGSVGHEKRKIDEQSHLKFLGLSIPQLRKFAKEVNQTLNSFPIKKQIEIIFDIYLNSERHEELTLALILLKRKECMTFLTQNPDLIFSLQRKVDNWAISDGVSDFVATLSETNPKLHFQQLQKWNKSTSPWDRRQSLVGIYYYARSRKSPVSPKKSLPLVQKLIDDPHYYVQKAVGWSLREIYQVDENIQFNFIVKHIEKLSSVAFTTAIEKYPPNFKKKIKDLRVIKRKPKKN